MSTRGMVAIDWSGNRQSYNLYYRHTDTYPTGLGVELAEFLKKHDLEKMQRPEVEETLKKELGVQGEGRSVHLPREAFTKVQGDLEYIYVVNARLPSMRILKTSNLQSTKKEYASAIYWSYAQFLPKSKKEVEKQMAEVERATAISSEMLEQHEIANNPEFANKTLYYEHGGLVQKTGYAKVHKGELVIPASTVKRIKRTSPKYEPHEYPAHLERREEPLKSNRGQGGYFRHRKEHSINRRKAYKNRGR